MAELSLWTILSVLAVFVVMLVYHLSMAWAAHWYGIKVEQVSIGWGPLGMGFSVPGKNWEWYFGAIPISGSTKFLDMGDKAAEWESAAEESTAPVPGSFLAASAPVKMLILFLGPFSAIVTGAVLLAIPVFVVAGQLRLTASETSTITPCAVGGMLIEENPSTAEGQAELVRSIAGGALRKYAFIEPLDGWGGYVGSLVTSGACGRASGLAWLSAVGTLAVMLGLVNLLPIPTVNGGQIVLLIVEGLLGKTIREGVQIVLTCVGLLLILIVFCRILAADALWLYGLIVS